ncbi:MAG: DUF3305 domain-containing protein [Alphaproteobacteria bacterium]|nr:DUF3305 domain-containing protein [Alphaproteobacteria bacterium]
MPNQKSDAFDAREIRMPLGIVVEKRPATSRWISHTWRPVAVLPGASEITEWKLLDQTDGVERFQIATLELELHRKETEAYLVNLANEVPSIYVVLRAPDPEDDDPEAPEISAVRATASPFEAQDFLDCGEDIVEPVPMTEGLIAWVQAFVDRHHQEAPFKKRKRKDFRREEPAFGKVLHPIEQRFYDKSKLN